MARAARKPKQPSGHDLEAVANAWGVLLAVADMLRDIERGIMPIRYDIAGMADTAEAVADDLAEMLPDDPDQLRLIA